MATGKFPYQAWGSPFEQLKQVNYHLNPYLKLKHNNFPSQVVKDDPPRLKKSEEFSDRLENFITACLQKRYTDRPTYDQLLQHIFIVENTQMETDVASFVEEVLNLPG